MYRKRGKRSLKNRISAFLLLCVMLVSVPHQVLAENEAGFSAEETSSQDDVNETSAAEETKEADETTRAEETAEMTGVAEAADAADAVEEERSGEISTHEVRFFNYDTSVLHLFTDVPEGARLYSRADIEKMDLNPQEGCSWYLYYPGNTEEGIAAFGPNGIRNPEREGYIFLDWAVKSADNQGNYTVGRNTDFFARFSSRNNYLVNLNYEYGTDNHLAAAETSTVPYGLNDRMEIMLPDPEIEKNAGLRGLIPVIQAQEGATPAQREACMKINNMLEDSKKFCGQLNPSFLSDCIQAGFLEVDGEGNPIPDGENNIVINIPVTYNIPGSIRYEVNYYQQNVDGKTYTLMENETETRSISNSLTVDLNKAGLMKEFEGFNMREDSAAMETTGVVVRPDSSSVISLYYNRKTANIYFLMNGGSARDPEEHMYGETLPGYPTIPVRTGYTFTGWTCMIDGKEQTECPARMPEQDLHYVAHWEAADSSYKLIYWMENADNNNYSNVAYVTIPARTGDRIGKGTEYEADISDYLETDYLADKFSDAKFFTYDHCDTTKEVQGNSGTVFNVYYSRNEYTLEFRAGRKNGTTWQISNGGSSLATNSEYNFRWMDVTTEPVIQKGTTRYTTDNPYTITAKYGADISALWPTKGNEPDITIPASNSGYVLFTWGTTYGSKYYSTHPGNRNIIGIYATMSEELVCDDQGNPMDKHVLIAYWNSSGNVRNYHYLFEALPGLGNVTKVNKSAYASYTAVEVSSTSDYDRLPEYFYEYKVAVVRTSASPAKQNPTAFPSMDFKYGCYNGNEIYFFYSYKNYSILYYENNPSTVTRKTFYHIPGKTIEEGNPGQVYRYEPRAKVSEYGNTYTFLGWFRDEDCTVPEEWNEEQSGNVTLYAGWEVPKFQVVLKIPGGSLSEASEQNLTDSEFPWEKKVTETGTEYTLKDIPEGFDGERFGELLADDPISNEKLPFDKWIYFNGNREMHFLFDASMVVSSDMVLEARWQTTKTGKYLVQYITTDKPAGTNYGTMMQNGVTYYKLLPNKEVDNVVLGSSVTENSVAILGYLVSAANITKVVRPPDEAGRPTTIYQFVYRKAVRPVTYYVHYVRSTGVDYGRKEPGEDVEELAPTKKVVAEVGGSATVRERAVSVGGYSPRDGWMQNMVLSLDETENHLYFYYVSNTTMVKYQVRYFFMDLEGNYSLSPDMIFDVESNAALGKFLYARDYTKDFDTFLPEDTPEEKREELNRLMIGHSLDEALSDRYIIVRKNEAGDTGEEISNVLNIRMKLGSYTLRYVLGNEENYQTSWVTPPGGTKVSEDIYEQRTDYPNAVMPPLTAPTKFAHDFAGWSTDGTESGIVCRTMEEMLASDYYKQGSFKERKGLYEDTTLYAMWKKKITVKYHLRGGTWQDTGTGYHMINPDEEGMITVEFPTSEGVLQAPAQPSLSGYGMDYTFLGWTDKNPDTWKGTVFNANGEADMGTVGALLYPFMEKVNQDLELWAIWNPDPAGMLLTKRDSAGKVLTGAVFSLQRLQSSVSKQGDDYIISLPSGSVEEIMKKTDSSYPAQHKTTDGNGKIAFPVLSPGYYLLTEEEAPDGYVAAGGNRTVLYIPYRGQRQIYFSESVINVLNNFPDVFHIEIKNLRQYGFQIEPEDMNFNVSVPDFTWNPETLKYEVVPGGEFVWSGGRNISVTNTSESGSKFYATAYWNVSEAYEEFLEGKLMHENLEYVGAPVEILYQDTKTFSIMLKNKEGRLLQFPKDIAVEVGTVTVRLTAE